MSSEIMTNNIKLAILAFAGGMTLGIATLYCCSSTDCIWVERERSIAMPDSATISLRRSRRTGLSN